MNRNSVTYAVAGLRVRDFLTLPAARQRPAAAGADLVTPDLSDTDAISSWLLNV